MKENKRKFQGLAEIKLIKKRMVTKMEELLNIAALANACVSIFSLQCSMLASFGNMSPPKPRFFNDARPGTAYAIAEHSATR